MEQDEIVYEYRFQGQAFRFEAHHDVDAEHWRPYALLHFRDRLGSRFVESELEGPVRVGLPPTFQIDRPRNSSYANVPYNHD